MNPKNTAVSAVVLTACALMCACTPLDKFTIRDISNSPSMEPQQLVLEQPCQYAAGTDISGKLSPGPLQPAAIGIPVSSNADVKEPIYLIQVSDVEVQSKYDVVGSIGVRKDGTFFPDLLLHSNVPGASPFANESVKMRFKPENCHYSMQSVE